MTLLILTFPVCLPQDVVLMTGFTLARSPTAHKDGLHSCNLQLGGAADGGGACVYVSPHSHASCDPTGLHLGFSCILPS